MLRGVNVSGRNRLPMGDFAEALTSLGFDEVVTYLQSGNAVVDARGRPATVASATADMLAESFGLSVPVVVRTAEELQSVLAGNPYLAAESDPTKLHVTFLAEQPDRRATVDRPVGAGKDTFEVAGRDVYLHCPGGYGRSKLTNDFFERRLGAPATTRNWRSVVALAELAERNAAGR
jgi:uncharacterized protein (DUF1697 family)